MPPVGYRQHVLDAMPGTRSQIASKVSMAPRTLTGLLKSLRESGACHVSGWQRSDGSGNFQPLYVAGPGENVPCKLKPYTDAQVGHRYWKSIKKDERGERRKARDAARYYAKKAAKNGDVLVNALFGRK